MPVDKNASPPADAALKWLVNHQHDSALARYADIAGGDDLRRLFSEYVYPPWERRRDYRFRAEFYKKVFTGQTMKAMAPFRPLFRKQLEKLQQVDSLEENLLMIIDLYDLSTELDKRIAAHLLENRPPAALDDAAYRAALRECSSSAELRRITDTVLALAEYARRTVEAGGFIDALARTFPTIPVFKKNYYVRGANEIIGMAKAAYRAARDNRERLAEFIAVIREREYAFINSAMDGAGETEG